MYVGKLEDFLQISKMVRQFRQNWIVLLDDKVLKRFKIMVYILLFLSNRHETVHVFV